MNNKKTFTIIDVLIIAVIIVVGVVGIMKFMPKNSAKENTKVEFTVMLTSKDKGFSKSITEGDNVIISLSEKDSGVVKDVKSETAKINAFDSINGQYKIETIEDKEDIYITIECDAQITDTFIKTGDTLLKVGVELPVRGKGYASMGYIIDVKDE